MSEYQYYEFLAIDRPLDEDARAVVRSLSTRAAITATSFVNEYHWGDFKGDPEWLMERYYDAHLYAANWGTRRVMFRLPSDRLDPDVAEDYCVGYQVTARAAGDFLVLAFTSEDEPDEFDDDHTASLSAIAGVRTELAAGDLRPLYLAWLAAYGTWERDEDAFDRESDDDLEPPVPPGLRTLTAAQRALADFLRLDDDLLETAAETSPPLEVVTGDVTAWVAQLPATEKTHLLTRVLNGDAARVRWELLHRFRGHSTAAIPPRRTAGDLLDTAARRRTTRPPQDF
ncbi:hypothetical protein [Amycolatopsis albispora]|uniref:hypothetical protein n=1 Tax=Amycolatopsis albispora TaxID=1804986 RepID=UPI001F2B2F19|nr:hypothetical protein [Amycolatopsis albispora]